MKRLIIAILALAAILVTAVSCKDKFSTKGDDIVSTLVFTRTIPDDGYIDSEIAAIFGRFADTFTFDQETDKAGFYYGTDPNLKTGDIKKVEFQDWWGEEEDTSLWKCFLANIYPLTPNTVYYYKAWLLHDGVEHVGAIFSFKTKPKAVTDVIVTPSTATILLASENKTVQLSAEVYPPEASDHSVIWYSESTSVATVDENGLVTGHSEGWTNVTAYSVQNNSIYGRCKVTVVPGPPEDAVDMGLPSGKYWANRDLGASSESYAGSFFSWAENHAKNPPFNVANYPMGDEWDNFSKYNGHDNYTYIREEDDAAYAILGSNWRVPSNEEWNELIDNCTLSKSSAGFTLTAINKGQDGVKHSLFFPFKGYYEASELKYVLDGEDYGSEQCFYWGNEVLTYYSGQTYYKYGLCRRFYYYSGSYYGKNVRLVRWFGARIRPIYRVGN